MATPRADVARTTNQGETVRVWLTLLVALLTAGCQSVPGDSTAAIAPSDSSSVDAMVDESGADVLLTFDDLPPALSVQQVRNRGTANLVVDEVSVTGALLALDVDREGGQAIRFPTVGAPPAVITVASRDVPDVLDPGAEDFVFGADVKLDRRVIAMQARGLAGEDNGNNVFQRGLFTDPSQYKLQVDDGYASCLLRGSGGQVIVSVDRRVPPDQWTRLRCMRDGNRITLTQDVLEGRRQGESLRASTAAPLGTVATGRGQGPAAVGGKVNSEGDPVRQDSDQFNGSIDNVFYDLLGNS